MKCIIAGGGTGGHLFPGMAVAEAFMEREKENEVLFIGTERGIEARVLADGRFPLKMIHAMPIQGRSITGKLRALWSLPKSLVEALTILKEYQPQIVLGVGGYASGPAVLAASLLGMKRAIHEQNVIPGMTNRVLKGFSQRIFISFEETKRYFPAGKAIVTGNPIRKEIIASASSREREDRFIVLVFGGSAGARRINVAILEALDSLKELRSSLKFIHQTGKEDFGPVAKGYEEKGFEAEVAPFIDEMARAYRRADLVICRSGASTVAELAVCGKAAILIPYPYAAHQHQLINAQKLVDRGAAKMIRDDELKGPLLSETIRHLYHYPKERERMEKAIQKIGRPRAAEEIVDHCYDLIGNISTPTPTPTLP
ncbi:MAG: undecaprenyldiphospho-muramoylpentapeptide beta-N-acetylglucosaminyltransferase, partial [Deltaproteobacteria bacterium]|nr:undecaprenyldiphospho-muramoylpentapeptide beta-N-acetylglucosaminyltransferase [Deltaproteobacteria bacterium]